MNALILFIVVLLNAAIVKHAYTANADWYYALLISIPLLLLAKRVDLRRDHNERNEETGNFSLSMLQRIRNYFL